MTRRVAWKVVRVAALLWFVLGCGSVSVAPQDASGGEGGAQGSAGGAGSAAGTTGAAGTSGATDASSGGAGSVGAAGAGGTAYPTCAATPIIQNGCNPQCRGANVRDGGGCLVY